MATNGDDQPVPLPQLLDAMAGLDDVADLIQNYPSHFTAWDGPTLIQLQRTMQRIHATHPGRQATPGV
jgi:hypothetical protein